MHNLSLPVKQERGDHILLSLKQNPHVEGINVKWFCSAYPGTLYSKERDKFFQKVTQIKNESPLLSIETPNLDMQVR